MYGLKIQNESIKKKVEDEITETILLLLLKEILKK